MAEIKGWTSLSMAGRAKLLEIHGQLLRSRITNEIMAYTLEAKQKNAGGIRPPAPLLTIHVLADLIGRTLATSPADVRAEFTATVLNEIAMGAGFHLKELTLHPGVPDAHLSTTPPPSEEQH